VRTIIDISVPTIARLASLKNVVGIKDATAKVERVTAQRLACGKDFIQLSGEDGTALGFNAHGGKGCISVTSNVAPRLCAEFQTACHKGDWQKARELNDRLMPLHEALFCETSPGPVKYAASRLGLCSAELRLPMVPIAEESKRRVDAALAAVGLASLARAAE
jgi:4-hydroxy-tetrahydrodipicolinate synthase